MLGGVEGNSEENDYDKLQALLENYSAMPTYGCADVAGSSDPVLGATISQKNKAIRSCENTANTSTTLKHQHT